LSALYVVSSEFCERFSFYGMKAILGLFFVERLGMDERDATVCMSLFVVACYVTPLLGAYISDARIGRYKTIVRLSGVYLAGSCLLALAAASASGALSALALGLVALGTVLVLVLRGGTTRPPMFS
jgi:dipeptide/tripeptide permease